MLRTLAIIFGIILVVIGVMGFIPAYVTEGKLLNIFRINLEHNIVHIATGFIAFLCGLSGGFSSKMFFIIFGVVYSFIAVLGFMQGDGMLFDMIAINLADNILHLCIGISSLLIGFGFKY